MTEAQYAPQAPEGSSRFSLLSFWVAIWKNWPITVGITLAVALGATFYTLGQTKIYQSTAVVLFDPSTPQPLGDRIETVVDTSAEFWKNREYFKTQAWIMSSQRIAEAVVKQLNLHRDAAFLDGVPDGKSKNSREVPFEVAAQRLSSQLVVEQIKDSRLAQVRFRDSDPQRAQRILAALVDTYTQSNLDDLTQATTGAADWLHSQLGALKKDLDGTELALHEYKKKNSILAMSMTDQANMLRTEILQLDTALTEALKKRAQVLSRLAELRQIPRDNPVVVPVTELLNNASLQRLRGDYVDASRELAAQAALGKGDAHPDVRAAVSRQQTTLSALLAEIDNIIGALEGDLRGVEHEAGGLKGLISEAKKRALDLNLLEIEHNRLQRAKDNNEKLFSIVMERSKESDLTKMLRINNIRVVERPPVPKGPVSPNVPLNIATGLIVGLALGMAASIGREQLDRSIKVPGDLERDLGLTVLGILPSVEEGSISDRGHQKRRRGRPLEPAAGEAELIVHRHPMSGVAEAARAIRTNILFMSPDRPHRTLLITSAGPREGKTTVACCIATAIAQAGRRVVLVDCDMRRPRLHRVFGCERDLGLTTALMDQPNLDSIIHPTEVPNLSVVTTGPLPPNPAEILHSAAFARLLEALRERFDTVVLDSPPLVPVTDAAVLSAYVDGTILVVRAFTTTRDLAGRAVRALGDVNARVVGTVLNAVDLSRNEYGYRYYYYQHQGYASTDNVSGDGDGGASGGRSTRSRSPQESAKLS